MENFFLTGKRVLITGGAGNIGLTLARALAGRCKSVVLADCRDLPSENDLRVCRDVSYMQQDVTSPDTWSPFENKADVIFHLAAQTSAYKSNELIMDDWKINVQPLIHLLDFLKGRAWRPAVIFASTATVVGLTESCPVDESRREDPLTVYDIHKLTAEKYLRYYHQSLGGSGAALRLANVYGPGGGGSSANDRGIVNQMIRKCLRREGLVLFGRGDYVRDYVFLPDVVAAFLAAGARAEELGGDAYFIGTGVGHTIEQLASMIIERVARVTGQRSSVSRQPFPPGALSIEERSFMADTRRFRKLTGWEPKVGLEEGISLTVDHFSQREK